MGPCLYFRRLLTPVCVFCLCILAPSYRPHPSLSPPNLCLHRPARSLTPSAPGASGGGAPRPFPDRVAAAPLWLPCPSSKVIFHCSEFRQHFSELGLSLVKPRNIVNPSLGPRSLFLNGVYFFSSESFLLNLRALEQTHLHEGLTVIVLQRRKQYISETATSHLFCLSTPQMRLPSALKGFRENPLNV